jgi:hypothetical protein
MFRLISRIEYSFTRNGESGIKVRFSYSSFENPFLGVTFIAQLKPRSESLTEKTAEFPVSLIGVADFIGILHWSKISWML